MRKCPLARPLASILAPAAGLFCAARASAQAYRIMPVGDSITVGCTDNPTWSVPFEFGYRSGLYTRLNNDLQTQGGFPFQYVGGSTQPFDGSLGTVHNTPSPDLRTVNQDFHEGYSGVGTSFVNSNIAGWLSSDKPDIVLLMIGINDIGSGSSAAPTAAEANLNSIVQTVVTNRPNADLIVAQITPYTTYTPAITQYNAYIRALTATETAQGKHVSTVDQYSNFLVAGDTTGTQIDPSLYSNGSNHPNATGYDRMAQTWYAGIKSLNLPATPPAQPAAPVNLVNNGSFETPAYTATSHNINPSGAGWAFTSGVSGAGSGIDRGDPYGAGNGSAADGSQQAFLQSSGNGTVTSISQAVTGFTAGQKYQLTFQAKAIQGFQGANPFEVELIDGSTVIPLFGGNDITPVASGYTLYTSDPFTAGNPTLTLEFFDHGLSTVQKVSWIDAVNISPVPEPALPGVLALGALGMLVRRPRRARMERGE